MSKVIMSNGGFTVELLKLNVFQRVEGNTTNPCIGNFTRQNSLYEHALGVYR